MNQKKRGRRLEAPATSNINLKLPNKYSRGLRHVNTNNTASAEKRELCQVMPKGALTALTDKPSGPVGTQRRVQRRAASSEGH